MELLYKTDKALLSMMRKKVKYYENRITKYREEGNEDMVSWCSGMLEGYAEAVYQLFGKVTVQKVCDKQGRVCEVYIHLLA